MPQFCILEDKLISTEDVYKFNIDKDSEFICYNCDKRLHFRKCRNADKPYTEHFYHKNTIKGTHVDCDSVTYETVKKDKTEFHNMFSKLIKNNNREIIRWFESKKHIVDGYDKENNIGVEFQNSEISVEDIKSRDKTTELDWIFNIENQYIRTVIIGNKIVCEIPHNNWEEGIKVVENNVFLYTGRKTWIWLIDRDSYRIEIEGKTRNVWIGEICYLNDVLQNTCLQNIITDEGIKILNNINNDVESVKNINAKCEKSMVLFDEIHRNYINSHTFNKNQIVGIKSVAGSGKTTTILNLSKIHCNKKILYIAFNKSLITEIKNKIKCQNIKNMDAFTFDSLLYKIYISMKRTEPNTYDLRPQFIGKIIPFLNDKPYIMRKYFCDKFIDFCQNSIYNDMCTFCLENLGGKRRPLLEQMWDKVKQQKLTTYESIRKQAYIDKWFNPFIDKNYDLIMIDEVQDFDMIMLKMLLNDTTIPKLFVGDPKQSIYQFRGCINAFNHLPKEALIIEFYSTFRIGNPLCDIIRNKFDDCWMISKSKNETNLVSSFEPHDKYIYLFRSWRCLLETAEKTKNIWINDYDRKIPQIINLHKKLKYANYENDESDDDLPNFIRSLTSCQLEQMLNNISYNIVSFENSSIKLYTIHSYKGMEDDNIRFANDIEPKRHCELEDKCESEDNLRYVAITRVKKKLVID